VIDRQEKNGAGEGIVPPKNKAHRFRPDAKLLRFLDSL